MFLDRLSVLCCKVLFCALTIGVSAPLCGMEPNEERKETSVLEASSEIRRFAIGAMAGAWDVALCQPFDNAKIRRQISGRSRIDACRCFGKLSADPRKYFREELPAGLRTCLRESLADPGKHYRGSSVKFGSAMSTLAVQFVGKEGLKRVIPGDDFAAEAARAFGGGIISAPIVTTTELIITHMLKQKEGERKAAQKIVQDLIARYGMRVLSRGITAKAMREGIFMPGYSVLSPKIEELLYEFTGDKTAAKIAGSIIAGGITAFLSQPFDTISTNMQKDCGGEEAKTTWQTGRRIYQREGFKGFMRGSGLRYASVAATLAIIHNWDEFAEARLTKSSTSASGSGERS